jgi:hypothetical protein
MRVLSIALILALVTLTFSCSTSFYRRHTTKSFTTHQFKKFKKSRNEKQVVLADEKIDNEVVADGAVKKRERKVESLAIKTPVELGSVANNVSFSQKTLNEDVELQEKYVVNTKKRDLEELFPITTEDSTYYDDYTEEEKADIAYYAGKDAKIAKVLAIIGLVAFLTVIFSFVSVPLLIVALVFAQRALKAPFITLSGSRNARFARAVALTIFSLIILTIVLIVGIVFYFF